MSKTGQQKRDEAELQRLQIGAALAVGIVILSVIMLRAYLGNVLRAEWWRP